jgi:hypothetical protein
MKIPKECALLDDNAFNQKGKPYSCNMMNRWCRKAINYPTDEDTFLSEDAVKVLEKVEPNKEKGEDIYIIFNRVWHDVMPQGLKYVKEENMEEIIASYTFHTTMNTLSHSSYIKEPSDFPKTHKAGMESVRSWLKWTYNVIKTEELFEALIDLEDAMGEEKLLVTKVHEVLEAVMLVQEVKEDPRHEKEKILQEVEEVKEIENLLGTPIKDEAYEEFMKKLDERVAQAEEDLKKNFAELDKLTARNQVTIEEIKEISKVMNYGDQSIIENEIQVGVNQIIPTNIHRSKETRNKKKDQKEDLKRKKREELYDAVRSYFNEPFLPNVKVQEFLKKPPDISKNPSVEEIHLFDLIKERNQRELARKSPYKPWISRTKCKEVAELFYEEFVLNKKGVATRRGLSENCKRFSLDTKCGSLWSIKKVLCALMMIQGLITRRRDLNILDYPSPKLTGEVRGKATTGTVSFSPKRGS